MSFYVGFRTAKFKFDINFYKRNSKDLRQNDVRITYITKKLQDLMRFYCKILFYSTTILGILLTGPFYLLPERFVIMADDNCATCERTLRRHRRYVLSERLLETRRDFVEQLLRTVSGEVSISF